METSKCKICGKEFLRKENSTSQTCSKEHMYLLARQNQAKTQGMEFYYKSERNCVLCGKLFMPKTGSKIKFCSKECVYENMRRKEKKQRVCEVCGTIFYGNKKKACSKECAQKLRISTFTEKYGANNPGKVEEFKKKMENTCLQNFGFKSALSNPEIREKIKQTNIEKYGNEHPVKTEEIKKKTRETNIIKYGVDNPFKSPIIQDKIKDKNRKNLNVDYPMQSPLVREKAAQTMISKFGTPNAMKCKEIKEKAIDTLKRVYGVSNPTYINKGKDVFELFNDKQFLEDLYITQKLSTTTIEAMYGVSASFVSYKLHNFGIPLRDCCFSTPEEQISDFLKLHGIEITRRERTLLGDSKKEIDIYIPSKRIGIEFNGLFWHSEQMLRQANRNIEDPKKYHLQKTKDAESDNIHLIHIFEDDWRDKQQIVKSRLLRVLGISETPPIFARKCEVKNITFRTASLFCSMFHLQGYAPSSINLGLFYQNDLIGCMSFSELRKSLGTKSEENTYELTRFCTSFDVVGGVSKLFNFFLTNIKPKKVISYADRHWTSSLRKNMYDHLGFIKVSDGEPNYWYIVDWKRVHRFGYRKSELPKKLPNFDSSLTEYQNMLNHGHDRIWGCGSFKYKYFLPPY
jgi:hypothetical protein